MVYPSHYKNKPSIVLESEKIRAEFTADPGSKMVSLIGKDSGYEFLLQRDGEQYRDQPFDGVFIEGECSGFDEMFPTIDSCEYHLAPWEGTKMADHGEVWPLPWNMTVLDEEIHFQVNGIRFPYQLQKKVYFLSPDTLRIAYTLQNKSPWDFDFLWAGHIMLNLEVGTELIVPQECRQVVSILTNTDRQKEEVMDWPVFKDKTGQSYAANISRSESVKGFEKYYFTNKLLDGWALLKYPEGGKTLKVAFSAETVPYLGILMNENGWDDLYQIIIEPCTVCYDRPDLAEKRGQVSRVAGNGTYEWYVEITL